MTYGGKQLAAAFRTVRNNTIQIAEEIPESKYSFSAVPDTRTVEKQLTHIALASGFALYVHQNRIEDMAKLNFPELMQRAAADEAKPRTKAEVVELLKSEGAKFASFLEGASDSFLAEQVAMPPGAPQPSKTRLEMLMSAKEHEMHHRAQLMLIERMLGIVPHLTRERQQRMAQAQAARQG
jgi:uncharacterized damage-inducible protein DinB